MGVNMKKNKEIGSNFDDFLKDEGMLEEIEEVVAEKIFAFEMQKEMKKLGVDKAMPETDELTSYRT